MALGGGRPTNELANYFATAVQSAKNVEGTTFYFHKHMNGTGFDVKNDITSERIGGAGREVGLRYKTKITSDGAFNSYGWPDGVGRLLTYALGEDVPTVLIATSSAANELVKHLITPGGSLPYLTIEQQYADQRERVTNCVVSELKIEGEAGKPIKFSSNFISGGTPHRQSTELSPTRESGEPFMIPGASAVFEFEALGVAGEVGKATSSEITKWALDIKNTLDEAIQTLGLAREDVVWLDVDFNCDGTLKYTDQNIWNVINYGGGTQLPIPLATGSIHIFTQQAGSSKSMSLLMPLVQFGEVKVNRLDPDGKTMMLDFTGMTLKSGTTTVIGEIVTGATGAYSSSTT